MAIGYWLSSMAIRFFFFLQLLIIAYGHSVLTIANGHWLLLLAIVMAIGYWF
jgi:hypothetical protein